MVLLTDCGEPVITCDHSMLPQQHNISTISTVHVAAKHNFLLTKNYMEPGPNGFIKQIYLVTLLKYLC